MSAQPVPATGPPISKSAQPFLKKVKDLIYLLETFSSECTTFPTTVLSNGRLPRTKEECNTMATVLHDFANYLRDLISPQGMFYVSGAARGDEKGIGELGSMYANLQKLKEKYNKQIRQEHPHSGVLAIRFNVEKQLGDFNRIGWSMEQRLNDELVRRLRSERGDMKKQRDDIKKERNGMQKERNDMKKERDDAMESLMKEIKEQAKKLQLEAEKEESNGSGYDPEFEKLRAEVNEVNQEVNRMMKAHNKVLRQLSEMMLGKDTEVEKLRQVQATEKDKSVRKFAQDFEKAKNHVRILQRREIDLKARLVGQEGLIKGLRLCIGNTRRDLD